MRTPGEKGGLVEVGKSFQSGARAGRRRIRQSFGGTEAHELELQEERMTGTKRGFRRRRVLVDKKLQVGLSLHIIGYVYFYLVVFALLANFNALKTPGHFSW